MHDVFGNSVALVDFDAPAAELSIVSTLKIERYANERFDFPISPEAESYPFMHSADDRSDLGRLRERHYQDRGQVETWARQFVIEQPTYTFNRRVSPFNPHEYLLEARRVVLVKPSKAPGRAA